MDGWRVRSAGRQLLKCCELRVTELRVSGITESVKEGIFISFRNPK